ncbi:MAG: nucleotidyltransferase family protein [Candidatus Thorarchaeota archaeon]
MTGADSYVINKQKDTSDIDFLVEFEENADLFHFIGLSRYLEEIFNTKVDVISKSSLKKDLKQHILQEVIFEYQVVDLLEGYKKELNYTSYIASFFQKKIYYLFISTYITLIPCATERLAKPSSLVIKIPPHCLATFNIFLSINPLSFFINS